MIGVDCSRLIPLSMLLVLMTMARLGGAIPDAGDAIQAARAEEAAAGIRPTGNFGRYDARKTAYYRCYYTGKLELPESYEGLKLRNGTKAGCRVNEKRYDVFFYAVEAVASGRTPVTQALVSATLERVATVVPHEDFHVQVEDLPEDVAEPAATLVGLVAGSAAAGRLGVDLNGEAELFLRKARIVNRYFGQVRSLYSTVQRTGDRQRGLAEKQRLLEELQRECGAVKPAARSFNRCLAAANNAGLAFDYTYTRYYPLVYDVYRTCGYDLPCTIRTIEHAPRRRPQSEVVRYLERFVRP